MPNANRIAIVTAALLAVTVACHKPTPPAPAPVRGPNADSIARVDAARRDSIARADAARRDAAARADAARRDSIARADAARASAAAAARDRATLTAAIYFDFEQDATRPDATSALDAKVPILRDHADLRIRIAGHADDRGSDEYNLALGQRRAAVARRYLVARGIAEGRMEVISFGEQRPVCTAETESCWQQNRRDEFEIIAGSVQAVQTRPRSPQ